ncbi:hypothetical protein RYX36_024240, partial [Vicia faba]
RIQNPNRTKDHTPLKMDAHNSEHSQIIEISVDLNDPGRKICGEAPCGFLDAGSITLDSKERSTSMRKLLIAVILCVIFMTVELVGGIKANSLAILTDAAHLLSDVAAFAISLFSLWAAGHGITVSTHDLTKDEHHHHTHDNHTHHDEENHSEDQHNHTHEDHIHHHTDGGVTEPLLAESKDKSKKKRNINVQGAYLHVLGDSIQSIGVMIGGAVIWYKPEWKIVDLICTLIFSVIVLGTTINMLRNILEVLMESTPREIDATQLERGILDIEEVVAVHELHIWAITVGKILLACHVKINRDADADVVLDKVVDYIKRVYNISHVTIQIER